jgi:hypothetical protein
MSDFHPHIHLPKGLVSSLQNLSEKSQGKPFRWMNIAEALELTRLGFAQRGRSGWNITAEGSKALQLSNLTAARPSAELAYLAGARVH